MVQVVSKKLMLGLDISHSSLSGGAKSMNGVNALLLWERGRSFYWSRGLYRVKYGMFIRKAKIYFLSRVLYKDDIDLLFTVTISKCVILYKH